MKIKPTVKTLPTIALKIPIFKKLLMLAINSMAQVVLVPGPSATCLQNVAVSKLFPNISKL